MKKESGVITIGVAIAIVVGGVIITWMTKPDLLPGTAAHRAKVSVQATQQVKDTTVKVDEATRKQGAEVAAGLTKISEANGMAPASSARDFITLESANLLTMLPAPDPIALMEAEKRRAAVMEGQRDEARRLYETAAKKADQLQQERDAALVARDAAELKRQRADEDFTKAAAAEHARTMQAMGASIFAIVLLVVIGYLKLFGINTNTLGRIAADIRAGNDPIQTLDTHLAPWLHPAVQRAAKLASDLPNPPST